MSTRTAKEIIESAYRKLGAIDPEDTPGDAIMAVGLEELQDMLTALSLDGFMLYFQDTISKVLTAGDGDYSIGEDGTPDWNTPRPEWIISAYTSGSGQDAPLNIVDVKAWNRIPNKTDQGVPSKLYYDPEYPNGTIKLYKAPSAAYTLYMTIGLLLEEPATVTTDLSFPPGYNEMMKYNLAVRLAPEMGVSVTAELAGLAKAARTRIRRVNAANQTGSVPMELASIVKRGRSYSINRGY